MQRVWPLLLLALLSGCPQHGQQAGKQTDAGDGAGPPALRVALLRTDLGLADGELVRRADAALEELADAGALEYTPVGALPPALEREAGAGDVGLPDPKGPQPGVPSSGIMTADQARALVDQAAATDLLVVSGPLVANLALERIAAGDLEVEALLLLDTYGPPLSANQPMPVYRIDYDIKPAAYMLGVAAGTSSRTQQFIVLTSTLDPRADDLVAAALAGLRYKMNGAVIFQQQLTPDAEDLITPEAYFGALQAIRADVGGGLSVDHYFVDLGRSTPSVMHALSKLPTDGFVLGGYGDFRTVRPQRIVGTIVKDPAPALAKLLDGLAGVEGLAERTQDGTYTATFAEGAVDLTAFDQFAKFNTSAVDLEEAVAAVRGQIEAGELDVDEQIELSRR
jgi:hypothetical protein